MFHYKYPVPRANAKIKKPQVILQRNETTQQTNVRVTISICAAIAGITAIDERKYSERGR